MTRRGPSRRSRAVAALLLTLALIGTAVRTTSATGAPLPPSSDAAPAAGYQGGPTHDGHAGGPLGRDLSLAWSLDLSSALGNVQYPLIADGRVFLWGGQTIRAVDAHDGSLLWQRTTATTIVGTAFWDGEIIALASQGQVVAWSAVDGAELWGQALEANTWQWGGPVASGGLVYFFGSYAPDATALDATDGHVVWDTRSGGAEGSAPVTVESGVYVGTQWSSAIVGRSATTGQQLWSITTNPSPSTTPVPAHDGRLWLTNTIADMKTGAFAGWNPLGSTIAFDGSRVIGGYGQLSGGPESDPAALTWSSAAKDYRGPMLTVDGLVASVAAGPRIDLLDDASGALVYSYPVPGFDYLDGGNATTTGMASADGVLVVPIGSHVYAFTTPEAMSALPKVAAPTPAPVTPTTITNGVRGPSWTNVGGDARHDGRAGDTVTSSLPAAWSDSTAPNIVGQPLIVPGAVLYANVTAGGVNQLHAVNPTTGQPLWPTMTFSSWIGSIVAGDGVVVVFTSAGAQGIEIDDGHRLWTSTKPCCGGQADDSGHLFAGDSVYDMTTGELLAGDGGSSGTAPAVDGTTAYLAGAASSMDRYDSGRPTWSWNVSTFGYSALLPVVFEDAVDARPLPSDGLLRSRDDGHAIGVLRSDVLPAADNHTSFTVEGDDLVAADVLTGLVHWRSTLDHPVAQPVVAQGRVLVEDVFGDLEILDEATGAELGVTTTDANPPALNSGTVLGPAVAQGLVVVVTANGIEAFHDGSSTSAGAPDAPHAPAALPSPSVSPVPGSMPPSVPPPAPSSSASISAPSPSPSTHPSSPTSAPTSASISTHATIPPTHAGTPAGATTTSAVLKAHWVLPHVTLHRHAGHWVVTATFSRAWAGRWVELQVLRKGHWILVRAVRVRADGRWSATLPSAHVTRWARIRARGDIVHLPTTSAALRVAV
ncbi:MAG TPA: PQQ-binding-like beta-propeller repeat protein [Mycobacteriales bacterium]|nr:PQQ-binding-like beta-propeller repeat protein [Mycobacteriales bacterium]